MQDITVNDDIVVFTGYGINTNSPELRWFVNASVLASEESAIRAAGSFSEFNLAGRNVSSTQSIGFELIGDGITLNNSSYIDGTSGVVVTGSSATIYNNDKISGTKAEAVYIKTAASALTTISNFADIIAWKVAITVASGRLLLHNYGHITGEVKLAAGADTVVNPGTIAGDVHLGNGADLFDATGGLVVGEVRGGRGDDVLTGGLSGDRLVGGRGDDILDGGGASRDILKGGKGADTFVFAEFHGVDRIKDFDVGKDTIRIDNALLPGLDDGPLAKGALVVGSRAADADDRIIYNDKSGVLKYDANGDLAGGVIKIAKLAPGLDLSHHHVEVV